MVPSPLSWPRAGLPQGFTRQRPHVGWAPGQHHILIPDAVDAERERTGEDRNWAPPLVRDRKTQQAMEKPAGPAGTRAWHKRPLAAIMGKIDRETIMTRARLCFQREAAVARLRTIPKPIARRMLRLGYLQDFIAAGYFYHDERKRD